MSDKNNGSEQRDKYEAQGTVKIVRKLHCIFSDECSESYCPHTYIYMWMISAFMLNIASVRRLTSKGIIKYYIKGFSGAVVSTTTE